MALIQKISPVGIDSLINSIQEEFYETVSWVNASHGYESYPRVYRNESQIGNLPEVYLGNNEYQDVFMDDKFSASSFFITDERRTVNNGLTDTSFHMVFQVLLNELYGAVSHRADEEAHQEAMQILDGLAYGFEVTDLEIGVNNVYRSLAFDDKDNDDMHPYHVFKITMESSTQFECIDIDALI